MLQQHYIRVVNGERLLHRNMVPERRLHTGGNIVIPVVADGMCNVSVAQHGAHEAVGAKTRYVVVTETHRCHINGG